MAIGIIFKALEAQRKQQVAQLVQVSLSLYNNYKRLGSVLHMLFLKRLVGDEI